MRRNNTATVEGPPRRGVRDAPPALTTRGCAVPPRSSPRMLSREIGVLMLILAAQTIMGVVNMDNVLSTELMADSQSFHGRPSLNNKNYASSSSYYSSASSEKQVPYAGMSEGMSSSTANSEVSEGLEDDHDEEEVLAARLASQLTTPRRAHERFAHDEDVWENIFSFLPWETALQLRGVSKFHFRESLPRVTIARMPQSKAAAVFIPCLEDLDSDEMAVEAELAPQSAGALARGSGGQRLFLGQLRRTGTVPMVRWLVNTVFNAPPGALVSVENRRNTHTQRGKGCAWPTINDEATVQRMLAAHHRLFFDTVNGVEGVWLVPEGQEAVLQSEVSMRYDDGEHERHMPRGTIVVEKPSAPAAPPVSAGRPRDGRFGGYAAPRTMHRANATSHYGSAALPYGSGMSYPCAGMPGPAYAQNQCAYGSPMGAAPSHYAAFTPYRVPGVDYVQPGVYRLNPYTAALQCEGGARA